MSQQQTYPGLNILTMGPSGTGKTHALSTLCDVKIDGKPLEVFAFFLEPGLETLIGAFTDSAPRGRNTSIPPNLHWHYLQPKTQGFGQLRTTADNVGKFNLSALAKMQDTNRGANNQVVSFLEVLNDFTDQRDGKKYGPVDSWGTDRVICIDSLSAMNRIMMDMVVGTKPVRDQSDWGIAQNNLMNLLHKLTTGCNCHFVLIAHVDREVDQILGGVKLMPSTLGKAIASSISQPFSDVILTTREIDQFFWDTANSQADVKTRNLSFSSKLPANFVPIFDQWTKRREASKVLQPA